MASPRLPKPPKYPPLEIGEALPFEVEVYVESNGDVTFADLADQILALAAAIGRKTEEQIKQDRMSIEANNRSK